MPPVFLALRDLIACQQHPSWTKLGLLNPLANTDVAAQLVLMH